MIAGKRDAAGDVFDMRGQATVFVDDEDGGAPARLNAQGGGVPGHLAAVWERPDLAARDQARVLRRNDRGGGGAGGDAG